MECWSERGLFGESTLIPPTLHLQADSSKVNGLVLSAGVISTDNMPMGLPKKGEGRREEGRGGKGREGKGVRGGEGRGGEEWGEQGGQEWG